MQINQYELETIMNVKIVQQTAVLQHFFSKNTQTFQNLQFNSFPVPAKRMYQDCEMKKQQTISTAESTSCSETEEPVQTPKQDNCIQNEQFVHYSNILPANDKKTEAINTLIGKFHNLLIESSNVEECQLFRSNVYKVLETMAMNWSEIKYQQAESLAAAVLLIVCMMTQIKQKFLVDSIKKFELNAFTKVSCIKKTKSYVLLNKVLNKK